jgi:hypothetical protein
MIRTIRLGASAVAGRSHSKNGKRCEDAVARHKFRKSPTDAYIALADGAGSAPAGDEGANLLVEEIGPLIRSKRDVVLVGGNEARHFLYSELHKKLESKASALGHPLRDMASTLLFVYLHRDDGRYIAGHIGDGVVAIKENGSYKVLSPPEQGEFANETIFFTSSCASTRLRLYTGTAGLNISFMLMSDGTADSLYEKRNGQLAPACGEIFRWFEKCREDMAAEALAHNLKSLIVNQTHDDCSIAVMQASGEKTGLSRGRRRRDV